MCVHNAYYRRACDKWTHTSQPASVHILKNSAFLFILLRPCQPKILHFLVGIFYSFNNACTHSRTRLKSFIHARIKKRAYSFLSKLFQPTNNLLKPKTKTENENWKQLSNLNWAYHNFNFIIWYTHQACIWWFCIKFIFSFT